MHPANNAGTFPVSYPVTANTAMTRKQVINDVAQKILSLVDLIIIVTDEEGIILEANRSACELFCYSVEELTGWRADRARSGNRQIPERQPMDIGDQHARYHTAQAPSAGVNPAVDTRRIDRLTQPQIDSRTAE
ncbi:MAG: PAS domain S-box protein [Nitrosomonadaceae bacterium]|nr:PAS domain S-box protein [Nitrosomonadaceae bacterium]